ncbi:oxidative stress-induced growth inhibitor 2-like [Carassius auratus]|uniref:Oxidative stress-induced growth inhibitor 1 n=1 Tax=Carassius auratus TaxID=7957 RepID=A0A6P6PMJ2_CARAU|nr:oxidative stress-induced growth inhibitor 2-like [Carassius auratus]XP_026121972.1 oxidative stress-induced growth inhibitor 2-like [Carassius auratus]XP_026121974.1 oxidative stress-induced growth inhibitor 2-like [Carassius auratus]
MELYNKDIFSDDILPVVIVGNGPSGICLSYLLSGYTPYLSPDGFHPNPILHNKLKENPHLSLFDQDLEYLCEGVEGRSSNPVAVLFDALLLPDGDFGVECASPLIWRHEPERATPHLVLGKGPPGGAWHAMEGSMLTLSLANWMELPGVKLKEWMRDKRRNLRNDRATPAEIASYYQHYVTKMGLEKSFACGTTVTSVSRVSLESGRSVWKIQGLQKRASSGEEIEVPFAVYAENVVLATGTHDIPARLDVEGENLPFVCHSFWELEAAISSGRLDSASEPVLVVGAGLTAADAVLAAHHLNTPVYHAFRRPVSDPALIFNQLPKLLYPEYHKVHQMMSQQQCKGGETVANLSNQPLSSPADGNCYPGYLSFPKHHVAAFRSDGKCVLEDEGGKQTVLQVSMALVLIGAHPNLSFLPEHGGPLALDSEEPISCRRNPLDVDPYTYECVKEPGMYAMGPLVGENFVRFLKGGALAIVCDIARKRSKKRQENCTASSLNIQLTNCTLEA